MNTNATIPATFPVEFIERTICLAEEAYRPQIGGVVTFDGKLNDARLARAVRLLLDAEPVLGCRFVADGAPPVWQRLGNLDSMSILDVRECEDQEGAAAAFIAEPLDFTTGPQLLVALLRGPSSDALAVKVTHVVMDGGALKETLYLIGEFYRSLLERPEWTPEPNLDGVRHPMAKAGVIEKLGSFRQSDMTLRPSDWKMTVLDDRGREAYLTSTVEPDVFRSALGLGKSVGATANDVILTAYYRTLWLLLGAAPGARTPIMNSCELRKHLPAGTKTALSNISSAWYVSVPSPAEVETFDQTLDRVVAATGEWKRNGAGRNSAIGIPIVDRLMRKKDMESMRKLLFGKDTEVGQQVAGLTNIGVIDDSKLTFGPSACVTDAWLLGPVSHVALILTTTTYRDRLHLALGAELAALDKELAEGVVTGTANEIESWVAARGMQVA